MEYIILLSLLTGSKSTGKPKTAIQELTEIAKQKQIEKYSIIPTHCLGSIKYNDTTINGLTRCIFDLLKFNGCHVVRSSKEERTTCLKTVINNTFVLIKIMNTRDQQSDSERQYHKEVEEAGGVCVLATDLASFSNWLNEFKEKGGTL
jgi:hypothetical protein